MWGGGRKLRRVLGNAKEGMLPKNIGSAWKKSKKLMDYE